MKTAPLLLVVLLLAPLASALPLEARIDDARVIVELGEGLPASFLVVVTHSDERAWVDRVVKVTKDDSPNATLRLDGLPRGVPLTIRILPANTTLPTLASAPDHLDAARIVAIPTIAEVTTPALDADAADHVVPVHVRRGGHVSMSELRAFPTGELALIHTRVVTEGTSTTAGTVALAVAFSQDGGRTWGRNLSISPASTQMPQFRSTVDGGGKLVVIYGAREWVDEPDDYDPGYESFEPWRFVRIDPASERILVDRTLRIDGEDIQWNGGDIVAGPGDGTTLIAGGYLHELDSDGRSTPLTSHAVRVVEIDEEGRTDLIGELEGILCCMDIRAASAGDAIAVIGTWAGPEQGDSTRGWLSVSTSGADGFGRPRNITLGTIPSDGWTVWAHHVLVDASGNANVIFGAGAPQDPSSSSSPWRYESYHFYAPKSGSVVAHALTAMTPRPTPGSSEGASGGIMAQSGKTVWLSWSMGWQNRWLARSTDGGKTLQTPMLMRSSEEPFQLEATGNHPMTALPDGRVAFLGGSYGDGIAFPFEPQLPEGSRLNRLYVAPPPPPPPPPRDQVDVGNLTPRAISIPYGGETRVTFTLKNVGASPHVVSLTMPSRGTPLLIEPSSLELQAGESVVVSATVRLARDASASGVQTASVLARDDRGNTSASNDIEVRWDGPPVPTTPAPTRPPVASTPPTASTPTPTAPPSATPPPMATPPPAEPLPTTPSPIPGPGALLVVALVAALALLARRRA